MVFVLVNIIKANKTNKQTNKQESSFSYRASPKTKKNKGKNSVKFWLFLYTLCVNRLIFGFLVWFFVRGESSLTWISYHILDKSMFHSFIHCFYIRFRNVQNFPFPWKKSHVFLHLAVTVNRGMRKRRKLNYQIKCGWLVG